jgi:hypothetical protein
VTFADPANTFHEKAMICRAAENTCYFASVNFASEGSGTTSAVVRPGFPSPNAEPEKTRSADPPRKVD